MKLLYITSGTGNVYLNEMLIIHPLIYNRLISVVDRVLQKKEPLLFDNTVLQIEECIKDEDHDVYEDNTGYFESEKTFAVLAKGFSDCTPDEIVSLYFESQNGANADIVRKEKIAKDSYVIEFENEEAVNEVLRKTHSISERKIEVTKYIPVPRYKDKIFVKGISQNTTRDGLFNFLAAKSNAEPTDILYGKEKRTAVVTFAEPPDLKRLQSVCSKIPLDDNHLDVTLLPMTDCVVITGFSDKTTEEYIQFYFENTKKSGVNGIKGIKMNKEAGLCFVYFKDFKAPTIVCGRSHSLDGQKLDATIYFECLGIPFNERECQNLQVPNAVKMEQLDKQKLLFLFQSKSYKEKLEANLKDTFGEVKWHNRNDFPDSIEIVCTLTPETKGFCNLVKDWGKKVEEEVNKLLDDIKVQQFTILPEAWDDVAERLSDLTCLNSIIRMEKEKNLLIAIGLLNEVLGISKKVSTIIKDVENILNEKRKEIQCQIDLEKFEILLLTKTGFIQTLDCDHGKIKVQIEKERNSVILIGTESRIQYAKNKLLCKLREIAHKSTGSMSKNMVSFLKREDVREVVDTTLQLKQCTTVWEITNNNTVMMHSVSEPEVNAAIKTFRETVVETTIKVPEEQLNILQSNSWAKFIPTIEKNGKDRVVQILSSQDNVTVLATSTSDAGNVQEHIQDFFYKNTFSDQRLTLPNEELRFLSENCRDDIEKISSDLKDECVEIKISNDGIFLRGNANGISKAKQQIDSFLLSVVRTSHTINRLGIVQHIRSDVGKINVENIEQRYRVAIEIQNSNGENDNGNASEIKRSALKETANCLTPSGQMITTVVGDITDLYVDVIVNAANNKLQHLGGLAKVVVDKGGEIIQHECSEHIRKKVGTQKEMLPGEVFWSSPGNLHCKMVAHAVGPMYDGGKSREEEYLFECIKTSLKEADSQGFESIAFPALCAGNFNYPVEEVCRVIMASTKEFLKTKRPSTSIKHIYLCDTKEKTVTQFVSAMKRCYGETNVQELKQKSTQREWEPSISKTEKSVFQQFVDQNVPSHQIHPYAITLVKGAIANQQVHIIVNSAAGNLQLQNGAVSKSLLNVAGNVLQAECTSKYPNGIQPGKVAITSSGNLRCSLVFHGALNNWKSPNALKMANNITGLNTVFNGFIGISTRPTHYKPISPEELEMFIHNCLSKASEMGFVSIAFPALGTGNLGYPKKEAARLMFRFVDSFFTQNPTSSVMDVRFVIYDQDIESIQAFEDENSKRSGKGYVGLREQRFLGCSEQDMANGEKVSVNFGDVTVKIYQGDICYSDVKVVVNCTNRDFKPQKGSASELIFQKGGQIMRSELEAQGKCMKKDKYVMTSARPPFKCEHIIHLEVQESSMDLKLIKMVIDKVESTAKNSVAFSPEETGLSMERNADVFYDIFKNLHTKNSYQLEVHLVFMKDDIMKKFIEALKSRVDSDSQTTLWNKFTGLFKYSKPSIKSKPSFSVNSTKEQSQVCVMVYAKNMSSANKAIEALEEALSQSFTEQVVEEPIIKSLSDQQVQSLQRLEEKHLVELQIKQSIGRIKITGLHENIIRVTREMYKIFKSAEVERQKEEHAKMMSGVVQWRFIDVTDEGEKVIDYPKDINLKLEQSFQQDEPFTVFRDNKGRNYVVDFLKYKEYPEDNPLDVVKVIRSNKLPGFGFEPPASWDPMDDTEEIKEVDLKQSDSEYRQVVQSIGGNVDVVKIQRIQNRVLRQQYDVKKRSMEKNNQHNYERTLWHGTSIDAERSIVNHGFNRSFCGKNATMYGNGVYFAKEFAYSARAQYAKPDPNNLKRIFMCKVLTGEFTQGVEGLKVPPEKPSASNILYDSVVDDPANPIIFVIFQDSQAYPEYLIIFK